MTTRTAIRRCTVCHRAKKLTEFPKNGKNAAGRDTFRPNCKRCHAADRSRRYRLANPEIKCKPMREHVGEVFGKLTITSFVGYRVTKRGRTPIMNCKCACGKRKKVSYKDLRSGKTKTCGFNHPHYEDRRMPAFNMIYRHSYKGRAEKAGLAFSISPGQFMGISQQPCHYCGALPQAASYRGNRGALKTGKHLSKFVYNGLDRVDSRKGYTLKNVVPCCGVCNHAKHTMSYRDFCAWLDRIVQFRNGRAVAVTRTRDALVLLNDEN